MLIVAYTVNDTLVRNVDVEAQQLGCSAIILISLTVILFGGNITWIIFQYIYFTGDGCGWNFWQITITCVAGVAMYALVLLRTRKDASVFTSSLVLTYILYLQWSGLSSSPNELCNPYTTSAWNTTFLMILGLVFTFASLIVISSATAKDEKAVQTNDNAQAAVNVATGMNAPLMEKESAEDVKLAQANIQKEAKGEAPEYRPLPITPATIMFQALLILSAVYYSMLLTNWGTPSLFNNSTINFFNKSYYGYWIQISAQWVSMLIYLYSMTAPLLCPDRFSDE